MFNSMFDGDWQPIPPEQKTLFGAAVLLIAAGIFVAVLIFIAKMILDYK